MESSTLWNERTGDIEEMAMRILSKEFLSFSEIISRNRNVELGLYI